MKSPHFPPVPLSQIPPPSSVPSCLTVHLKNSGKRRSYSTRNQSLSYISPSICSTSRPVLTVTTTTIETPQCAPTRHRFIGCMVHGVTRFTAVRMEPHDRLHPLPNSPEGSRRHCELRTSTQDYENKDNSPLAINCSCIAMAPSAHSTSVP